MTRIAGLAGVWTLLSAAATVSADRTASPRRPEFDAAIIRLNKSAGKRADTDVEDAINPGGRLRMRNVPLKVLIAYAYAHTDSFVDTYVADAPGWTAEERYDITANAPAGSPEGSLPLMLQKFLEREFKLQTHQEQQMRDVFVLQVAKNGPKLKAANGSGDSDCDWNDHPGTNYGGAHRLCTDMSMADLAGELPWMGRGYIDRPVIDQTGLGGHYDFRLDYMSMRRIDKDGGLTIFDALARLGLRLKQRRVAVKVTVVDHVEPLADDQ